jgi:hypothetical protein
MSNSRCMAWAGLVAAALLAATLSGCAGCEKRSGADGSVAERKGRNPYASHYFVVPFTDARGVERVLAFDFNRTTLPGGRAEWEYKAFVSNGSTWEMPAYATWQGDLRGDAWPVGGGLSIDLFAAHRRMILTNPAAVIEVDLPPVQFRDDKPGEGRTDTTHALARVTVDGTTTTAPLVYEYVRNDAPADPTTQPAGFGTFEWVVLRDSRGRLWQVCVSDRETFAYHAADLAAVPHRAGRPGDAAPPTAPTPTTSPVPRIAWLSTERDPATGRDTPTRWRVDVDAWDLHLELRRTGQHRGRGDAPAADGKPPLYEQIGVTGDGTVAGERVTVFGMVEHIQN